MTIRDATISDLPRIIELGVMLHKESPRFSRSPFNEGKAADFLAGLIHGDRGFLVVADREGEIIGGMAGMIVSEWFSDEPFAYDVSLFIEPKHRGSILPMRLLLAYKEWARSKGVRRAVGGIGTGINVEKTAALYRRVGMEEIGPILEFIIEG